MFLKKICGMLVFETLKNKNSYFLNSNTCFCLRLYGNWLSSFIRSSEYALSPGPAMAQIGDNIIMVQTSTSTHPDSTGKDILIWDYNAARYGNTSCWVSIEAASMYFWSVSWSTNCPVYFSFCFCCPPKNCPVSETGIFFWSVSLLEDEQKNQRNRPDRDLSRDDCIEEFIKRIWSSGLVWAVGLQSGLQWLKNSQMH